MRPAPARRRFLRNAALLTAAATLSSCGFALRGSANLRFKSIYLDFAPASTLGIELKRYIEASGTRVVDNPKEAEALFDVLSETRDKAVLSLNSQGRVREYTLNYRFSFRVRDNQQNILLAPTSLALKRDISFNESQVLSKESEEALLYRDMQSDLVQQILRRLSAIDPTAPVVPVTPVTSGTAAPR